MKPSLKYAFQHEMTVAKTAYNIMDDQTAFSHLERAHILGQRFFVPHFITHWWMLKIGFRQKDFREIFGQILRLFAVVPGFLFGWVPIGNTGGANVSAIKPMPIPEDLEKILKENI